MIIFRYIALESSQHLLEAKLEVQWYFLSSWIAFNLSTFFETSSETEKQWYNIEISQYVLMETMWNLNGFYLHNTWVCLVLLNIICYSTRATNSYYSHMSSVIYRFSLYKISKWIKNQIFNLHIDLDLRLGRISVKSACTCDCCNVNAINNLILFSVSETLNEFLFFIVNQIDFKSRKIWINQTRTMSACIVLFTDRTFRFESWTTSE